MIRPIPDGFHAVTPSFTFKESQKAIDFYKKAFGAKVLDFMPNLNGKGCMHATMQIGDSIMMMGDEMPSENCSKSAETIGHSPISLYLYVSDADVAYKQAIAAGAVSTMPMMDTFWGDRAGAVKDPFGYSWMIATHKQDLTKDQINKGAESFFAQMAKK